MILWENACGIAVDSSSCFAILWPRKTLLKHLKTKEGNKMNKRITQKTKKGKFLHFKTHVLNLLQPIIHWSNELPHLWFHVLLCLVPSNFILISFVQQRSPDVSGVLRSEFGNSIKRWSYFWWQHHVFSLSVGGCFETNALSGVFARFNLTLHHCKTSFIVFLSNGHGPQVLVNSHPQWISRANAVVRASDLRLTRHETMSVRAKAFSCFSAHVKRTEMYTYLFLPKTFYPT